MGWYLWNTNNSKSFLKGNIIVKCWPTPFPFFLTLGKIGMMKKRERAISVTLPSKSRWLRNKSAIWGSIKEQIIEARQRRNSFKKKKKKKKELKTWGSVSLLFSSALFWSFFFVSCTTFSLFFKFLLPTAFQTMFIHLLNKDTEGFFTSCFKALFIWSPYCSLLLLILHARLLVMN